MYHQWQSGELRRPSAGRLLTVASVLVNRQHWAEAMVIAKEVAQEKPAAAAGIASCVLGGMGMSPESAELLSVAMPWFEQHDLHQQAVKVNLLWQKKYVHRLCLAFTAMDRELSTVAVAVLFLLYCVVLLFCYIYCIVM